MFGEKEKITVEISREKLIQAIKVFNDKNLDFEKGLNLLLLKFLEEENSLDDYIFEYLENYNDLANENLLNELNKGVESFDEFRIRGDEILLYLGVSDG